MINDVIFMAKGCHFYDNFHCFYSIIINQQDQSHVLVVGIGLIFL